MKVQKVHVFVLNYNGASLLVECLPSIIRAIQKTKYHAKLSVIDNESTDESLEILSRNFPHVGILRSENKYLCSFNPYVFRDESEVVILMNNDIKVTDNFIDPIVRMFERHEDAFVVSSLCWDFSGKNYEGGLSVLRKKFGWWGTLSADPREAVAFPFTVSVGACIAFRTDRFKALGGYDDLYLPGTLEDLDICYRGWKRGWKAYFQPESVIFHKGQASFREKFGSTKIRQMATRNTFLFTWKNIKDKNLIAEHFLWIIPRFAFAFLKGDFPFVKGCLEAFLKFREAWKRRRHDPEETVSDSQVLDIFQPLTVYV